MHLVVPAGAMAFLGAAPLSPAGRGGTSGAPVTTITSVRVNKSKRAARFTFRGSGGSGALSFKCKVDRGTWTSCRSPKTYKHLKRGKHTFEVEAVSSSGTADPTPAKTRFRV